MPRRKTRSKRAKRARYRRKPIRKRTYRSVPRSVYRRWFLPEHSERTLYRGTECTMKPPCPIDYSYYSLPTTGEACCRRKY